MRCWYRTSLLEGLCPSETLHSIIRNLLRSDEALCLQAYIYMGVGGMHYDAPLAQHPISPSPLRLMPPAAMYLCHSCLCCCCGCFSPPWESFNVSDWSRWNFVNISLTLAYMMPKRFILTQWSSYFGLHIMKIDDVGMRLWNVQVR